VVLDKVAHSKKMSHIFDVSGSQDG
jgi:hypothetical protein